MSGTTTRDIGVCVFSEAVGAFDEKKRKNPRL
jgi:hypothetical protein